MPVYKRTDSVEEIVVRCSCGSNAHELSLYTDDIEGMSSKLVVIGMRIPVYGLLKRIWIALSYVLRKRALRWPDYDEIIIDAQDATEIAEFLLMAAGWKMRGRQ